MATLDSFREATGEPIQLDLANGYIADIRLNAGDINGRTITVELTDNGTPITTTAEITCALDYNTSPGSSLGDRVTMSPVSGAAGHVPRSGAHKAPSPDASCWASRSAAAATRCARATSTGSWNAPCSTPRHPTRTTSSAGSNSSSSTPTRQPAAPTPQQARPTRPRRRRTRRPRPRTPPGKANTATTNASAAATAASTAASKANGAASSATTAASNANDKATAADTAATAAATAAGKANDAASKATSAAGDARDAAEAARTSTIEYAQLSDDCKEKIAASASAGVVFATQAEIDEQYETVIEPALGGDAIHPSPRRHRLGALHHQPVGRNIMANTQKVMTLEDTAKLIAKVHANATGGAKFEYDNAKGEYGNIAAYMAAHKDGKVYGVKFPKYTYSNTPTGVKTRDNANLTIEISTNAKAGRDDYAPLNAFRTWDVNATVDDDGVPHVTAIDGIDTRFKRDGSNGDVYVMTCPGYYKLESTSTHNEFLYSDTQYDGYAPLPGVLLPDGSKRPCLLFAKYAASLDSQQRPLSVSGKEIDREFGSQNRAIDYALKKGKGYAGRCAGDTFYVQLMLMLKYATKNSDVLGGCWQYTPQTAVTKAETGVKRVIIATSYANNFDVGSTVNVGTDKERNNAGNYSAARARTILSKTAIDDSNTALNLDGTPITTTTACFVSSMPWKTGATDKLLGTDGRPSAAFAANHQPIRLQGIELFNGIYESDADLIANAVKDNDNLGRIELYRVFDITKASKTSTANYTKIGEFAARDKTTNDSWRYAEDFTLSNGVIIPTGLGATSTTGMCDAIGANPLTSQGLRQVLRFGSLWDGVLSGAFAANLRSDLASAGGLRGPPVCARSHEGVAAVRWGEARGESPLSTFRNSLGFVAVRLRRPCVVQRFGNLRDGVQYGAFAANLRNDLANRRWNIGGRISGQSCQHDHYATTTLHASQ